MKFFVKKRGSSSLFFFLSLSESPPLEAFEESFFHSLDDEEKQRARLFRCLCFFCVSVMKKEEKS